jgi:hypothetical protein
MQNELHDPDPGIFKAPSVWPTALSTLAPM